MPHLLNSSGGHVVNCIVQGQEAGWPLWAPEQGQCVVGVDKQCAAAGWHGPVVDIREQTRQGVHHGPQVPGTWVMLIM